VFLGNVPHVPSTGPRSVFWGIPDSITTGVCLSTPPAMKDFASVHALLPSVMTPCTALHFIISIAILLLAKSFSVADLHGHKNRFIL
jgi:hypothetical protein